MAHVLQIAKMQEDKEKRKDDKKRSDAELQTLFKPVIVQQSLAAGKMKIDFEEMN